jgi:hypothetical protein
MGTYNHIGTVANRPAYKHESSELYLYYASNKGWWCIGSQMERMLNSLSWGKMIAEDDSLVPWDLASPWKAQRDMGDMAYVPVPKVKVVKAVDSIAWNGPDDIDASGCTVEITEGGAYSPPHTPHHTCDPACTLNTSAAREDTLYYYLPFTLQYTFPAPVSADSISIYAGDTNGHAKDLELTSDAGEVLASFTLPQESGWHTFPIQLARTQRLSLRATSSWGGYGSNCAYTYRVRFTGVLEMETANEMAKAIFEASKDEDEDGDLFFVLRGRISDEAMHRQGSHRIEAVGEDCHHNI